MVILTGGASHTGKTLLAQHLMQKTCAAAINMAAIIF